MTKQLKSEPTPQPVAPPAGLSERSQQLWKELVPSRCRSLGRLTMLAEALRVLDLADQAHEIVKAQGMVTTTKRSGVSHINPALKAERELRQQFLRTWETLGLQWDASVDGRTNWP
jgi:phage terminase small subunit